MSYYTVTTKRPDEDDRNCNCFIPALEGAGNHAPGCACFKPRILSRDTADTPDEAREMVHHVVARAEIAASPSQMHYDFDALYDQAHDLPESGGKVTLPDGTVVEVERA